MGCPSQIWGLRIGVPRACLGEQAAVVAPGGKTEKKLRGVLDTVFGGESR